VGIERTVNEELGCPILLGLFDKPCSGDQLFTGRFVRSAPLGGEYAGGELAARVCIIDADSSCGKFSLSAILGSLTPNSADISKGNLAQPDRQFEYLLLRHA
jgi:hypothetical protein